MKQKTARPSPLSGHRLPVGNHAGNTGGKKGRSGRLPSSVVLACQQIAQKERLIEVLASIARGGIPDAFFDKEGAVYTEATRNSDRIAATRILMAYAYGQPGTVDEDGANEPHEHALQLLR